MASTPELTPVQLAALDLLIADKQSGESDVAAGFITKVTKVTKFVVPVITATIGAAAAKASGNLSADEVAEQLNNLSLDQLVAIRDQVKGKSN